MITAIGARAVKAAAALQPLGLHLVLHGDRFLVTSKPDDTEHPGQEFATIEQVEDFIAARTRPAKPIEQRKPRTGDTVHYVSYGTPAGEYASECRAAIVTAGPRLVPGTFTEGGGEALSLCVLNPEGMFFNQHVLFHEGDAGRDHAGEEIPGRSYRGGSWHEAGHE